MDVGEVSSVTRSIAATLDRASTVRVTSGAGTELAFLITGASAIVDDGHLVERGSFGNLPAGEAYTVPVAGSARGVIVVEAGWRAGVRDRMEVKVEDGKIVAVTGGGHGGDRLRSILGLDGSEPGPSKTRRNIAEFGVGTNPNARRPVPTLEGEKILGTIHIGMGSNKFMGGEVASDFHTDLIVNHPDVWLDEAPFMKNGRIAE